MCYATLCYFYVNGCCVVSLCSSSCCCSCYLSCRLVFFFFSGLYVFCCWRSAREALNPAQLQLTRAGHFFLRLCVKQIYVFNDTFFKCVRVCGCVLHTQKYAIMECIEHTPREPQLSDACSKKKRKRTKGLAATSFETQQHSSIKFLKNFIFKAKHIN